MDSTKRLSFSSSSNTSLPDLGLFTGDILSDFLYFNEGMANKTVSAMTGKPTIAANRKLFNIKLSCNVKNKSDI